MIKITKKDIKNILKKTGFELGNFKKTWKNEK